MVPLETSVPNICRLLMPEDQQAETGVTNLSCHEESRGDTVGSLPTCMTRLL